MEHGSWIWSLHLTKDPLTCQDVPVFSCLYVYVDSGGVMAKTLLSHFLLPTVGPECHNQLEGERREQPASISLCPLEQMVKQGAHIGALGAGQPLWLPSPQRLWGPRTASIQEMLAGAAPWAESLHAPMVFRGQSL